MFATQSSFQEVLRRILNALSLSLPYFVEGSEQASRCAKLTDAPKTLSVALYTNYIVPNVLYSFVKAVVTRGVSISISPKWVH